MSKKKVGFWLDDALAKRLDIAADQFEGNKGEIVDAALTLFFRADQGIKRDVLREVMVSRADRLAESLADAPESMVEEVDADDDGPEATAKRGRRPRQGGAES